MDAITLSPALLKRLEKISSTSRRTPAAFVKQAVAEKLEYEEWALRQIDAGLSDVKAGRIISHDVPLKTLEQARHDLQLSGARQNHR